MLRVQNSGDRFGRVERRVIANGGFEPQVGLHRAETYLVIGWLAAFHVSINGTRLLTNFNIFVAAAKKTKAFIK